MLPTGLLSRLFLLSARHAASAHREHAGELGRAERHMRRARGQRVHAVAQRAQAAVDGLHAPSLSLADWDMCWRGGRGALRAPAYGRSRPTRLQPPGTPRAARGRAAHRAREGWAPPGGAQRQALHCARGARCLVTSEGPRPHLRLGQPLAHGLAAAQALRARQVHQPQPRVRRVAWALGVLVGLG